MPLKHLQLDLQRLPAPLPIWRGMVGPGAWVEAARSIADHGGRLVAMWGVDRGAANAPADAPMNESTPASLPHERSACAAYAVPDGLVWLELPIADGADSFPDLSATFPAANRMQRAMADLSGLRASEAQDQRPWLSHGLWTPGSVPLHPGTLPAGPESLPADYPFVRVEGDGVHEIAVGPVHAGIIEPGHFRFSVVGEKVLRLELHLGYVHKGIERRFTELAPLDAHRLAGRVSGDSTVAGAWAYCMALESAADHLIPERAAWLRALMLERERVANHLGDLGALGNDAALSFGLAQFSRLREDWQRLSQQAFGHRFMMDAVVPGGVAADLVPAMCDAQRRQRDALQIEVTRLRQVYDEHAGLQDRFMTCGRVTPDLAARLGLTGLAGRASAQAADLRCDHAWPPYRQLQAQLVTQEGGDVAARVAQRFDEVTESLRLIGEICRQLPEGDHHSPLQLHEQAAHGAGWVEAWRGEVLVALEIDAQQRIRRCHWHDPSWQNWPVLEHAVIGNIVPDFPLINKSFNLSYSGHDL